MSLRTTRVESVEQGYVWVYSLPPLPPQRVKKADYLAWLEARRGN